MLNMLTASVEARYDIDQVDPSPRPSTSTRHCAVLAWGPGAPTACSWDGPRCRYAISQADSLRVGFAHSDSLTLMLTLTLPLTLNESSPSPSFESHCDHCLSRATLAPHQGPRRPLAAAQLGRAAQLSG